MIYTHNTNNVLQYARIPQTSDSTDSSVVTLYSTSNSNVINRPSYFLTSVKYYITSITFKTIFILFLFRGVNLNAFYQLHI